MSHEELLSLPEGFAHRVAFVHSLDGGSSDVLDGCYGQSAVLQHELSHLTVPPQQSVVQRGVPAQQKCRCYSRLHPLTSAAAFVKGWVLTSLQCAPCDLERRCSPAAVSQHPGSHCYTTSGEPFAPVNPQRKASTHTATVSKSSDNIDNDSVFPFMDI